LSKPVNFLAIYEPGLLFAVWDREWRRSVWVAIRIRIWVANCEGSGKNARVAVAFCWPTDFWNFSDRFF